MKNHDTFKNSYLFKNDQQKKCYVLDNYNNLL
jgi:hypothetical protein